MEWTLLTVLEVPVRLTSSEGFDWPGWVTAIATAITAAILLATAWFARRAVQDAALTRHGQLVTEISRQWLEPSARESVRLTGEHGPTKLLALVDRIYGPSRAQATERERRRLSQLLDLPNRIEVLGILVSEKALTPDLVYDMWGGAILFAWPIWQEAIDKIRIYDKQADTFEHFKDIAASMESIADERKNTRPRPATPILVLEATIVLVALGLAFVAAVVGWVIGHYSK